MSVVISERELIASVSLLFWELGLYALKTEYNLRYCPLDAVDFLMILISNAKPLVFDSILVTHLFQNTLDFPLLILNSVKILKSTTFRK